MEEGILEALEYITISLDDIRDYQDFLKYKPEFLKAINDIKTIVQNKNQININETMENGEAEKSKISSILGLQFDYDPLINEVDGKFFADFDENSKDRNHKNNQNKMNNQNKIILKKINYEENKKNSLFNPDNILNCTESLRHKNKFLSKKNFGETGMVKNLKKNIKNQKKINNNRIKKYFDEEKHKEKIDIITDIIIKINNKDYLYKILTKLFGDNLSDKLLSKKVSDEFLESIQNAIFEIEKINEKYKKINNINEKIEKLYQEKIGIMKNQENKEENKESKINCIYGNERADFFYRPKISKNNINHFNKFKYSEPYQEFNFKKSLRNQTPKTFYKIKNRDNSINLSKIYSKNKKSNSISKTLETSGKIKSHKKPFVSATCNYGKYFDEPLQNGGESKLS